MTRSSVSIERTDNGIRITWDSGVEVVFALNGDRILGIRNVRHGGTDLRNPAKLWRPLISTPEGIHYAEFRLTSVREDGGAVSVEAKAVGFRTGLREQQDEYLGDVLELTPKDGPVTDRFTWEFTPSALDLGDRTFTGFSYAYRFQSSDPERRIYRVFDDATWEIGGRVAGNTLLLQGQVNPPITELTEEDYFTTACNYYGSELQGLLGPPKRLSFQRLPRIGTLQAFDFLSHAKGVLFNYFDPLIDVMSVLQKSSGEDVLHVVDELRRPLSDGLESHPKHILFSPANAPVPREEQRNLWCRAYDFVHERERARHGITASYVLPRVWTPQIPTDEYQLGPGRGPRDRAYHYLADEVLPKWAEMGVKEICVPSLWVSDYTVDRMKCKNDTGMHGELLVSGICCVRVHEIDPLYGGPEAVAAFTERAHSLGMTVQLWWASHLSRRAPIYEERPDFMLLARDGKPNGGGYGHRTIITMDLANPDCFKWELAKLKALHEATGVDGLFHDSYGNMTFLPVSYGDALRQGQQEAYARLVSELQKIGMKTFTVEGLGPWGVGHFGMSLLPTDSGGGRGYQNALDWWLEHPDMTYRLNMGIGAEVWPGREEEAEQFGFRCLANGGRFGFTAREDGVEMWDGWVREQNRLYSRIVPLTGKRSLLPDDQGVLWDTEVGGRLLFSFREFDFAAAEGQSVALITPDGEERMDLAELTFRTKPWSVYRMS